MTTANNWKVNADGDWSTAADWSLGHTPTSANTVTISTANVHTVTHSNGSDVISQLTVGNDFFVLSGGSLDILTTASFADGYTQTGGFLTVGAIAITGPASLLGGTSEGSTAFSVTGVTTLAGYTFGGASVLNVSSTANETSQIALGDATGVNAAIKTAAAGVFNIAGDFGITGGASSALFTNAGTIRKTAGSGTSVVGVSVNSTGTIAAASGNLQFNGPNSVIRGAVSGVGQVSFGGAGVTSLAGAISVATLGVYGSATVNLAANVSFAHAFVDASNGTSTLNLGAHTLALSGASASFAGLNGTANVTGSGTLSNKSVMTLNNVVLGGAVKVSNAKTINQSGSVTVGDGGGGVPTITNLSTGVYDFTTDVNLGQNNAISTFVNQGLLEKTGGAAGQSSVIAVGVTNTGTISAQSGTMAFTGAVTNTGTVSGAGAIQLALSGSLALNAGSVLSVATLQLRNTATLSFGTSLTYAGVFDDESNGTNQINLGASTLTLSGKANTIVGGNGVTVIAGAGTLANTGTLTLGTAVLDGTSQIDNGGTINQGASITIGGSGGQVASIVNAKGAHYNVAGAFLISNGAATASHFNNSGVVTVQAGIGTAIFGTTFNNLSGATLSIGTGSLESTGILNNSGTIAGKQLILGASGQTTLSAGSTMSVGEIDLIGEASLTLSASLTYAGQFVDASNGNTQIDLGANILTLTGVTDFDPANGDDVITGSGTLKLSHAATLDGVTLLVGGAAHLDILSKVLVTGTLQIGDGSANAANVVLAGTGTYDLVADTGVAKGASAASTLTNNGLFEKTAGGGTSVVAAHFVNNGTITVTSGTIEFLAGTLINNGTINGLQSTDGNGNLFISASGPGAVKASDGAPRPAIHHGSPGLLAQALAAFAVDQGDAAFVDLAATNLRQAHANALGAHPLERRLH